MHSLMGSSRVSPPHHGELNWEAKVQKHAPDAKLDSGLPAKWIKISLARTHPAIPAKPEP